MDQMYNYAQVASNCSRFESVDSGMTNSSQDSSSNSCLGCKHFENNHCKLDLYDKIEANLNKYSSEL